LHTLVFPSVHFMVESHKRFELAPLHSSSSYQMPRLLQLMLQHEAFTLMESHLLCTLMHQLITKIICTVLVALPVPEKLVLL
jgi:hypothetical protein